MKSSICGSKEELGSLLKGNIWVFKASLAITNGHAIWSNGLLCGVGNLIMKGPMRVWEEDKCGLCHCPPK